MAVYPVRKSRGRIGHDIPSSPPPASSFKHGAFTGGTNASQADAFGTLTSTTPRISMTYVYAANGYDMSSGDKTSWQTWLNGNSARRLILSVGTLPPPNSGLTQYKAAYSTTDFDSNFITMMQAWNNLGVGSKMIIRLDWEMNGNWFYWSGSTQNDPSGGNGTGYIARFRKFSDLVRTYLPGAKINWCPNWFPTISSSWFPGTSYVDIIGMDKYDNFVSGTVQQRWSQQIPDYDRQVAFAAANGSKQCALDEYGCCGTTTGGNSGGGDSPYYISSVADYVTAHSYAYACYFNNNSADVQSLLNNYPNAKAQYTTSYAQYTS